MEIQWVGMAWKFSRWQTNALCSIEVSIISKKKMIRIRTISGSNHIEVFVLLGCGYSMWWRCRRIHGFWHFIPSVEPSLSRWRRSGTSDDCREVSNMLSKSGERPSAFNSKDRKIANKEKSLHRSLSTAWNSQETSGPHVWWIKWMTIILGLGDCL